MGKLELLIGMRFEGDGNVLKLILVVNNTVKTLKPLKFTLENDEFCVCDIYLNFLSYKFFMHI